jgi:probable HAF family extracellular repeat protein
MIIGRSSGGACVLVGSIVFLSGCGDAPTPSEPEQARSEIQRGEMAAGYTIIDLGTLGGGFTESRGFGLNDMGQVVGFSADIADDHHAGLWEGGHLTELPTLGGTQSRAREVNNEGMIVGQAETADGEFHAALWYNGEVIDLGTLGGPQSGAAGINDRGQVVGNSIASDGLVHAFVWEDGVMTDLGIPPGGRFSTATDVNERGTIVGGWENADLEVKGAVWEDGGFVDFGDVIPNGINNLGQMVVVASFETGRHAGLLDRDELIDLGTLGGPSSRAPEINDAGVIAGFSSVASGQRLRRSLGG